MPSQPHTRALAVAVLLVGHGRALAGRATNIGYPRELLSLEMALGALLKAAGRWRAAQQTSGTHACARVQSRLARVVALPQKQRKEKEADARSPSLAAPDANARRVVARNVAGKRRGMWRCHVMVTCVYQCRQRLWQAVRGRRCAGGGRLAQEERERE